MELSKETSLFKNNSIKNDIISAGQGASAYITKITNDGIFVHQTDSGKSGDEPTDLDAYGVHISSNVDIINGGKVAASYGASGMNVYVNGAVANTVNSTGMTVKVSGANVASFGSSTTIGTRNSGTVGTNSMTIGSNLVASGEYSFAEGLNSNSTGRASHAEGAGVTASGDYSHAEGRDTEAQAHYSHVEGYKTKAITSTGNYGHAEGSETEVSGHAAHAEGSMCKAQAAYSHAEGRETVAGGYGAHAEGYKTTAGNNNASYAHAEGESTTASGANSHAEGQDTSASGANSHAAGNGTSAIGDEQTVIGRYNIGNNGQGSSGLAFLIGNGYSGARDDALRFSWEGNMWVAGGYSQGSDRRFKDHIAYLDNEAVEFIRNLKPAYYKKNQKEQVGFYAQDVEATDPWNCLTNTYNGFFSLDYVSMIAPLVKYCQYLEERIDKLERSK